MDCLGSLWFEDYPGTWERGGAMLCGEKIGVEALRELKRTGPAGRRHGRTQPSQPTLPLRGSTQPREDLAREVACIRGSMHPSELYS